MSKRELRITVGLPRSGKTTWSRQQGHPIVNPDSIRYAFHGERFITPEPFVWAMAFAMVDALFRAGHDVVIVDATNVTQKRRDEWFKVAQRCEAEFHVHVVDTPSAECIRRAVAEKDAEIIPVIARMASEWDLPGYDISAGAR